MRRSLTRHILMRARAPAVKVVFEWDGQAIAAGPVSVRQVFALADDVARTLLSDNHVKSGSKIKAVFLEVTVVAEPNAAVSINTNIFSWAIFKNPGGQNTLAQESLINIAQGMGQFQIATGHGVITNGITTTANNTVAPIPYRIVGWFKIPPRHQHMNPGDTLEFVISNRANAHSSALTYHGIALYKFRA